MVKLVQHFAHQRLHDGAVVLLLLYIFHRGEPGVGHGVELQLFHAGTHQPLQKHLNRAVRHFQRLRNFTKYPKVVNIVFLGVFNFRRFLRQGQHIFAGRFQRQINGDDGFFAVHRQRKRHPREHHHVPYRHRRHHLGQGKGSFHHLFHNFISVSKRINLCPAAHKRAFGLV